ncbi:unnamed protein product [Tuber melanosporum]|uniref:(Perigord truffle) hypothetical protein n=1 Tax=Tuber melanosporum (strain Mel28) TaxID=656061 RepID=D5G8Q4_TUBMM|nr:uncharacterized protein GSTUM_00003087001 [Tuber melanosporum]CAZ80897.1 unnamed protein product [Tuber melanosporum]
MAYLASSPPSLPFFLLFLLVLFVGAILRKMFKNLCFCLSILCFRDVSLYPLLYLSILKSLFVFWYLHLYLFGNGGLVSARQTIGTEGEREGEERSLI